MHRLTNRVPVYANAVAGVTVHKAVLADSNLEVAVKEQRSASLQHANDAIKESLNQAKLDHPNVCRIYECYMDPECKEGFKSVIVMEWMERDVFNNIKERQPHSSFWPESDIWRFMTELIECLAYAQSKSISHRDIKPQNIFLNSANEIKIGDFGASKWQLEDINKQSIQGTPFFLSPALRSHYRTYITTGNAQVTHNQYKSDVYSLGLTFLFMVNLIEPKELMNLTNLEANTELKLSRVQYSDRVKSVLRYMLAAREENRPDFLELLKLIDIQPRNGLAQFRLRVRSQDCSMNEKPQAVCPNCRQPCAVSPQSGSIHCPNPGCRPSQNVSMKSVKEAKVTDCIMCSKRFQAIGEVWRTRIAERYKRDEADFVSVCSEECAMAFLRLVNEDTTECCFCRTRCSNSKHRIALPCTGAHQFCSKQCLLIYCMRCTHNYTVQALIRCPGCLDPLRQEALQQAFEGRLEQEIVAYRTEHCAGCSAAGECGGRRAELPCKSHYLCAECMHSVYLSQNTVVCRYCDAAAPLDNPYECSATS